MGHEGQVRIEARLEAQPPGSLDIVHKSHDGRLLRAAQLVQQLQQGGCSSSSSRGGRAGQGSARQRVGIWCAAGEAAAVAAAVAVRPAVSTNQSGRCSSFRQQQLPAAAAAGSSGLRQQNGQRNPQAQARGLWQDAPAAAAAAEVTLPRAGNTTSLAVPLPDNGIRKLQSLPRCPAAPIRGLRP